MPVATVGSPQTIALGAADALIVSCSAVDAVASVAGSTGFIGAPYELGRVVGETGRKFGPYGRAVSLIVSALSGSITAEISQPSRVGDGADALTTRQGAAAQSLVSGDGISVHPNLWCDLSAANLCADDGTVLDGSGNARHAVRGIALPTATMNAAAGYFATAKGSGAVQSTLDTALHMPSINLDLNGGESLLIVILFKKAAPAADENIMGNASSTSFSGFRIRARSTGHVDHTLYSATGAVTSASGNSLATLADGALHQFAVLVDGSNKNRVFWEDGVLSRATITVPADCDTRESVGFHLGGTQLAPSAAGNTADVSWRRVTIFRWGPNDTLPSATDMTPVIQRLRNNLTRVPRQGEF